MRSGPGDKPWARKASLLAAALVASAALTQSCSTTPRPRITIQPEAIAADGLPTVAAHIVPNQFPVTDVTLEFGRRPSSANAVSVLYSSPSYLGVIPSGRPTSPTMQPFDVAFRFTNPGPAGAVPNPFLPGELIDYQFRVTHLNADNAPLIFWSPRKTVQVAPATAVSPPVVAPGAPGPGGNPPCDAPIANVSRPPNGISGGTTTDLGGTGPSISSDGGFVAFTSRTKFDPNASDVDQVYRRHLQTGAIVLVSRPARAINGGAVTDAGGRAPSISSDGRLVAFVTRTKFDANAADVDQVYVRDLQAGNVLRVSTPAGGATDLGGGSPVISGDGRFVAFVTKTKFDPNAADVDQVYRRDLQTGAIVPVTRPAQAINGGAVTDAGGRAPSISSDGRFVSFVTRTKFDPNAADGDQIYVRDLQTGSVLRVSTPAQGISGGSTQDLGGSAPVISGDGRFVAFVSRTRFDPNAPDVDEIYRRCLERP